MYTKFNQNYRGSRPYRGKVMPFPVDFCKFMYHEYTKPNQNYRGSRPYLGKVILYAMDTQNLTEITIFNMDTQNLTEIIEVS